MPSTPGETGGGAGAGPAVSVRLTLAERGAPDALGRRGRGGRGLYPSHVRKAWQALQLLAPPGRGPGQGALGLQIHTPEAFNAVERNELTIGRGAGLICKFIHGMHFTLHAGPT